MHYRDGFRATLDDVHEAMRGKIWVLVGWQHIFGPTAHVYRIIVNWMDVSYVWHSQLFDTTSPY